MHSLDSQVVVSSCGHVQGSLIIQVEDKDGEDTINASQNIELPLLIDSQSVNLGETSCIFNSFDQPPLLGCHHSHASICFDEWPCTSYDLLSSHVHSNSDPKCAPVKGDIYIKASFAPHLPLCLIIHNASTCIRDTSHSLASSSYELSPRSTQGN